MTLALFPLVVFAVGGYMFWHKIRVQKGEPGLPFGDALFQLFDRMAGTNLAPAHAQLAIPAAQDAVQLEAAPGGPAPQAAEAPQPEEGPAVGKKKEKKSKGSKKSKKKSKKDKKGEEATGEPAAAGEGTDAKEKKPKGSKKKKSKKEKVAA